MSGDSMLKCLIAFVLGFLVQRMMRGNGLSVGGQTYCNPDLLFPIQFCEGSGVACNTISDDKCETMADGERRCKCPDPHPDCCR